MHVNYPQATATTFFSLFFFFFGCVICFGFSKSLIKSRFELIYFWNTATVGEWVCGSEWVFTEFEDDGWWAVSWATTTATMCSRRRRRRRRRQSAWNFLRLFSPPHGLFLSCTLRDIPRLVPPLGNCFLLGCRFLFCYLYSLELMTLYNVTTRGGKERERERNNTWKTLRLSFFLFVSFQFAASRLLPNRHTSRLTHTQVTSHRRHATMTLNWNLRPSFFLFICKQQWNTNWEPKKYFDTVWRMTVDVLYYFFSPSSL